VITRLAVVGENELGHIVAEDRPYVAEEMRAFLFAFLEALPCPVVNPPSPACLCGPNLRAAQWRMFARQLHIPVADVNGNEEGQKVSPIDITVVGDRILGHGPEPLLEWTRQLAGLAGVRYLMVRYREVQGEYGFAGADPYPRLESQEIGKALVESFSPRLVRC
jgi:hypothetical protein